MEEKILIWEKFIELIKEQGSNHVIIPEGYTKLSDEGFRYFYRNRNPVDVEKVVYLMESVKYLSFPQTIRKIDSSIVKYLLNLENVYLPDISRTRPINNWDRFFNIFKKKKLNEYIEIKRDAFAYSSKILSKGLGKELIGLTLNEYRERSFNYLCVDLQNASLKLMRKYNTAINFYNELPMFTRENAVKYFNGNAEGISWFSNEEDRYKFLIWLDNEVNK